MLDVRPGTEVWLVSDGRVVTRFHTDMPPDKLITEISTGRRHYRCFIKGGSLTCSRHGSKVIIHPASERIDIGNLLKGPAQKAMLRERPVKPYPLTARQRQVLNGLAGGQTLAGIAYQIGISPHSVHHHVDALKRRFRAVSLSQLVSRAIASGLELSTPPQGGPGAGQVSE